MMAYGGGINFRSLISNCNFGFYHTIKIFRGKNQKFNFLIIIIGQINKILICFINNFLRLKFFLQKILIVSRTVIFAIYRSSV
jgi:hypothetical protein